MLSDKKTLQYFRALNKIFEQGILSKKKVTATDDHALDNIREGFAYYMEWCNEVQIQGVNPNDNSQTAFLSWQIRIHAYIHTIFLQVLIIIFMFT